MSLKPGANLAQYEVLSPLGAGGMGEVYRAKDTKLGREVAIKILPDGLADSRDRLGRLEREAKSLAALNHSNVATLYGFERDGNRHFLVMELIHGRDLATRIADGPLPLEEAIPIFIQIAEGLEAAHQAGIIHRDLKPANIRLTEDGIAKILDFGLAKAVQAPVPVGDLAQSRTLTAVADANETEDGSLIGTVVYMSPEQARGLRVDKRTDIWAFGACLYEALTATRPFDGPDAPGILASIVKEDPAWQLLPAEANTAIRRLLRRCLAKEPGRRLRDIGDAALELEDGLAEPVEPPPVGPPQSRWPAILAWGIAAMATGIAIAALKGAGGDEGGTQLVRRFDIGAERFENSWTDQAEISPDGQRVVYGGGGALWIRDMDRLTPRTVPESEGGSSAFWSPDSSDLAWSAGGRLWRMPAQGGRVRMVCELPEGGVIGGTWGADGRIVLAQWLGGLWETLADGGDVRLLEGRRENEIDFHGVHFLPDGHTLVFLVHEESEERWRIDALANGERRTVHEMRGRGLHGPIYSTRGYLLWDRTNSGIWGAELSLDQLTLSSEPILVSAGGQMPSSSNDGSLLFSSGPVGDTRQMAWMDRNGDLEPIGPSQSGITEPTLSPDRGRVAYIAGSDAGRDLFIRDLSRGGPSRQLTFDGEVKQSPSWSADGEDILFLASPADGSTVIAKVPANGGVERQVVTNAERSRWDLYSALDVSPDGLRVVYTTMGPTGRDLMSLELSRAEEPAPFANGPAQESRPRISPDGGLVAFTVVEGDQIAIAVRQFPEGAGQRLLSGGGRRKRWSSNGERLYYSQDVDEIWEVEVTREGTKPLRLEQPRRVLAAQSLGALVTTAGFDVAETAQGDRFLVVLHSQTTDEEQPALTLVQNWFADYNDPR